MQLNLKVLRKSMDKKSKNNKRLIESLTSSPLTSYQDKLAVLKYLIKNDSKNISSVFSKTLKKK